MGVSGLLPFVKKACRKGSIQEFSGKTLAVDVSFLLHRGVFGCAGEIANGVKTDFYVKYVRKHVDLLLRAGCHVILVFDGQPLPAKKDITDARRALREKNNRLGRDLMKQGMQSEAYRAFQQAVTITADIVTATIRAFQNVPMVDTIVAPYEADAQIAYFVLKGIAYAALTEDSDLIVFGCERIIFKLDTGGVCQVYELSRLSACVRPGIARRFEFAIFRRICILAGCDYLQGGLQGVGLKKAEIFFAKTAQTDLSSILPKVPLYLNLNNVRVDSAFIAEFIKAENTFLYQVVFDPIERRHTTLNPYPIELFGGEAGLLFSNNNKSLFDYAGEFATPSAALRRALGNTDLSRTIALDAFVLPTKPPAWSIWSGETYLNGLSEKIAQKQASVYDKLGAFASKTSPRRVVRRTLTALENAEDGGDISLVDTKTNDKKARELRKRSLQSSCSESAGDANLRNGTTLTWKSNDWMRLYGDAYSSNHFRAVSSQSGRFSALFKSRQSTLAAIPVLDPIGGEPASDASGPKRSDNNEALTLSQSRPAPSALNPFAAKRIRVSVDAMNGGDVLNESKLVESPSKSLAENIVATALDDVANDVENVEIISYDTSIKGVTQARQLSRPSSSSMSQDRAFPVYRLRRSLLQTNISASTPCLVLPSSSSLTSLSSSSSTGSSSCVSSQCSTQSSTVSSQDHTQQSLTKNIIQQRSTVALSTPLASTMSQEVFYRRRSAASQLCTTTSPLSTSVIAETNNNEEVDKPENRQHSLAYGDEKKCALTPTAAVPVRVSPYFLNNKLATPKPCSLQHRVSAFPRVL